MRKQQTATGTAIDFLKACGADDIKHRAGRSLLTHLLGTYGLLVDWGQSEAVALAGLYHSIYGTSHFEAVCVTAEREERQKIRRIIGEEAERLAYLFSAMDRNDFLANPQVSEVVNRFAADSLALRPGDAQVLCEILLANELDLAAAKKGTNRPDKIARKVGPYFEIIAPYVSEPARAAYYAATAQSQHHLDTSNSPGAETPL